MPGPTLTKVKTEGEPEFRLIKEGETVTEVIHGGASWVLPGAPLASLRLV